MVMLMMLNLLMLMMLTETKAMTKDVPRLMKSL